MRLSHLFRNQWEFALIYPDTVLLPINGEIIRKNAIGIDENGNASAPQSLIQPIGEISSPRGQRM